MRVNDQSMSLQPIEFFMRQVVVSPPSSFMLPACLCSVLWATAEVVRYCYTERPQGGWTAQVCWCLTKYNTEQPCREKPSVQLWWTKESAVVFLAVTWTVNLCVHLSLQNYHLSSHHLLLSSFSSSSFLSLNLRLCGSPAFAFCDCVSVSPFLYCHDHHCPALSCCPHLSWFLKFSCFCVDF